MMKSDAMRFFTGRLFRIRYCTNSTGSCFSCVRVSRVSFGYRFLSASSTWNLSRLSHCEVNSFANREKRGSAIIRSTSVSICFCNVPAAASCSIL